jgi:hypothetical protein
LKNIALKSKTDIYFETNFISKATFILRDQGGIIENDPMKRTSFRGLSININILGTRKY